VLSYYHVKQLIIAAANKLDVSVEEVFIICCTCGDRYYDVEQTIAEWERGRVPNWIEDTLIDLMADKIVPVLLKKGA
jgi:hypothetical protein